MTRVKKQKILHKVVGKTSNRVAITHFSCLIGNHFLSFLHRPMVNRGRLKKIRCFLLLLFVSISGSIEANNNPPTTDIFTLPPKKVIHSSHQHKITLPNFQNPLNILSEEEKQAGRLFFVSIQRFSSLNKDAILQQYIHDLGNLLVNYADIINPHYIFFVINEPSINAFAGPAGYIGIHSGLLLSASSEGMLASVLAHEIAHHKQRHLQRFIAAQQNSYANPLVVFGLILAGIVSQSPYVIPGVLALQGKHIEDSLNYLRQFEDEADATGINILQKAGFSGQYAADFMDRLLEKDFSLDSSEYLRTHPLTQKRIANLQNQIIDNHPHAPKSEFDLIQARLSYLSKLPTEKAFTPYQKKYINILSLLDNNEAIKARHAWQKITPQTRKESLLFNLLYMRILLNTNQIQAAQTQLKKLRHFYPNHLGVLALETQLNIQQNHLKKAEKNIMQYINDNESNLYQGHLWKLLGEIYFIQQKKVGLFYAKAKQHYTLGLMRKALEYLDNAIKTAQTKKKNMNEILKLKSIYNHWHKQLYTSSPEDITSPHKSH